MGYGSAPGQGTARYDTPNVDWLLEMGGGFKKTVKLLSSSQDAGNTGERVTKLRSGLVLAKITATGSNQNLYAPADYSLSDGREVAAGILLSKVDMLDEDGNTVSPFATMVFGPCYVDASKCYIENAAGAADQLSDVAAALTHLRGDGMVFKGDA